jgi:hypothetical protein
VQRVAAVEALAPAHVLCRTHDLVAGLRCDRARDCDLPSRLATSLGHARCARMKSLAPPRDLEQGINYWVCVMYA